MDAKGLIDLLQIVPEDWEVLVEIASYEGSKVPLYEGQAVSISWDSKSPPETAVLRIEV